MSLLKKKYRVLSVAAVLLILGCCGCGKEAEADKQVVVEQVAVNDSNPLVAEQVAKITYGNVTKRDLYDGVVSPYVEELYFINDGIFLEYTVTLGESVEEGQVLAKTDTTNIKERVEALEEQIANLTNQYNYQLASLKNREEILKVEMEINYIFLEDETYPSDRYTSLCLELGRQERSLKTNQLEQKHLTERYELQLPYLTKQLEELKKQLSANVIKAPFDGVVVQLQSVAGGSGVSTEIPYVAVADTTRYLVVSNYVGSNIIEKAQGVYAFINGKDYEAVYLPLDKEIYSKVMASDGEAYSSYEIQPDGSFSFGQAAKVSVVKEVKENVLVVPFVAIHQESNQRFCYVKRGTDREKVFIETGLFDGLYYEVKGGLAEGDEVYIE
ncbi:MAG: efflux RND transporter periplasmic adaptor subunit [Lachnospiraceae bacterium]|nr:efflux RND transporter periplasmic adaptor subunit [Lachnospiraceae bacterium]